MLRFRVLNLYIITTHCHADTVLIKLVHFPFLCQILVPICPLCAVLMGGIGPISLNRSLSLSPPKIVLHPSISLPSHTLSHLSHSLPCAFRFCLLFGPLFAFELSLLSTLFLSCPPLPPSFPPANCWSVLAIFILFFLSQFCEEEFKMMSFCFCSVRDCMVIDAQEEPRIRKSQYVSV